MTRTGGRLLGADPDGPLAEEGTDRSPLYRYHLRDRLAQAAQALHVEELALNTTARGHLSLYHDPQYVVRASHRVQHHGLAEGEHRRADRAAIEAQSRRVDSQLGRL